MRLLLPDNISSPQDVASLIIELREYSHWLAQKNILNRTHAKHEIEPPTLTAAAKGLINGLDAKKILEQHDLDELINAIESLKSSLPVITITLAAPVTNDIRKKLVDWCRKNIAPNILVNFAFNATLLGGMVVRCGSHIFDWSFKRQILQNRNNFPEVLRNV